MSDVLVLYFLDLMSLLKHNRPVLLFSGAPYSFHGVVFHAHFKTHLPFRQHWQWKQLNASRVLEEICGETGISVCISRASSWYAWTSADLEKPGGDDGL